MADNTQPVVEVLLLEDDPLDAELIVSRLEATDLHLHYTRVAAREEFERAVRARPYGLILADFALPDFDGLRALEIAREAQRHVPFIFVSGRVGEEVAIDTLQRGATDYVLKHRMERLVPAVLRALNESREHAARKQVEALFRQSESRFQYVIDAVPQLIWLSNVDGDLRYTNRAWQLYIGRDAVRCFSPETMQAADLAEFEHLWAAARHQPQGFTLEARLCHAADGEFRWHLIRLAPMQSEANSDGLQEELWVGSATDVQDQKMSEEALRTAEKLAVTGRMAASIAHEINNPLESLTNLIFLVRIESAGMEQSLHFLAMAESELSRIAAMTKQTLQFYRDPKIAVPIDVRELLHEVLTLFAARLASKSVHTELLLPAGIVFNGIKGEMRQVLINLVGNAIDAVPARGHIAAHGLVRQSGEKSELEIRISDNGSGFTPEQGEKLFQPFFSTKGAHGTGLGLWVSRGIVEKHGGELRLHIEAAPGGNVTVATLLLPLTVDVLLQGSGSGSDGRPPDSTLVM